MNREQEHYALRQELDLTPPALEGLFGKAEARARKRRIVRNGLLMSLGTIAAMFTLFVAMVNVFPTVASAMERIPGLQRLTVAVSFSPSLREAVEHDFAQPVGLEQTVNGFTKRIEYVIVDQQQLHVFYTLDTPEDLDVIPFSWASLFSSEGEPFYNYHMLSMSGPLHHRNSNLRQLLAIEVLDQMPDSLIVESGVLTFAVEGEGPEVLATFTFHLEFDPALIEQAEIITLDQDFILDGQRLTVTTVEIFPTLMWVNFSADESNTAWLRGLNFYFVNESGRHFFPPSDSVVATGPTGCLHSPDEPMLTTHRLESAFFAESQSLTMHIVGAVWLDKDRTHMRVDLANERADWLSDGIQRLYYARRSEAGWYLAFMLYERELRHIPPHTIRSLFMPLSALDEAGNAHRTREWRDYERHEGLKLYDYPYDIVYLPLWYSRIVRLEAPIEIQVK